MLGVRSVRSYTSIYEHENNQELHEHENNQLDIGVYVCVLPCSVQGIWSDYHKRPERNRGARLAYYFNRRQLHHREELDQHHDQE
jgi:hypothetical protein